MHTFIVAAMVTYLVCNALLVVAYIGRPRTAITPVEAVFGLVTTGLLVAGILAVS